MNETPSGFLKHAQEFYEASQLVVNRSDTVSLPGYFLIGRSIELSLKAYLLKCGISIKQLRTKKYGHDIRALLHAALENGLSDKVYITSIEFGSVYMLGFDYMEKRLEYRESGADYSLPYVDVASNIARKLAFDLQNFCS